MSDLVIKAVWWVVMAIMLVVDGNGSMVYLEEERRASENEGSFQLPRWLSSPFMKPHP